jgi:hypothetical protein
LYYDNLLNNEREFNKLREIIMSEHFEKIKKQFEEFKVFLSENSELIGESLTTNIIDKLSQISTSMNSINSGLNTSNPLGNNGVGATAEQQDANRNKLKNDPAYRESEIKRTQWVIENRTEEGLSTDVQERYLKLLQSYHSGGVVGDDPSPISNLMNKMFNLKADERVIKALKDEVMIPEQNIHSKFIPNLRNLIGSMNSPISSGVGAVYNLTLNFDKFSGNKSDADFVINKVVSGVRKLGGKL